MSFLAALLWALIGVGHPGAGHHIVPVAPGAAFHAGAATAAHGTYHARRGPHVMDSNAGGPA